MRIFAISDLHIDFPENETWFYNISREDFKNDILIIAGDITDKVPPIVKAFEYISKIFHKVIYTPGNHDLWVYRSNLKSSIDKFNLLNRIAYNSGIETTPCTFQSVRIVPLLAWYDYTFGTPSSELKKIWNDYVACKWPIDFDEQKITEYFLSMNKNISANEDLTVISFSHFLPRIDVMPYYIPKRNRVIYPALGTELLDKTIRELKSKIHVYGHSHVNIQRSINNIQYINNAFGYPHETTITSKALLSIYQSE